MELLVQYLRLEQATLDSIQLVCQQNNTHLHPTLSSPIHGLKKYCPPRYSPSKFCMHSLSPQSTRQGEKEWSSRLIVGRGCKNPSTPYLNLHCRCKFQPWGWRVEVHPKCWQVPPGLHGVRTHKTIVQPANTIKFVVALLTRLTSAKIKHDLQQPSEFKLATPT